MAVKTFALLLVLVLAQDAFSTSDDSSESIEEIRKNPTPKQKVYLYAMDKMSTLVKDYAQHAYEVCENILKDESLLANHNVEVEEFKNQLTNFVNKYRSTKNTDAKLNIMGAYNDITEHYYDLPKAKQTANTHFIVDILKKYNARKPAMDFHNQFEVFVDNFKKLFEESKAHMDKPTLEWFEKFNHTIDYDKKFNAFDRFWDLA